MAWFPARVEPAFFFDASGQLSPDDEDCASTDIEGSGKATLHLDGRLEIADLDAEVAHPDDFDDDHDFDETVE